MDNTPDGGHLQTQAFGSGALLLLCRFAEAGENGFLQLVGIVAEHGEGLARERVCDREHFRDIGRVRRDDTAATPTALLRPLEEYEAIAGGRW